MKKRPTWKDVARSTEPEHFEVFMAAVRSDLSRGKIQRKPTTNYREKPERVADNRRADIIVGDYLTTGREG